VILGCNSDVWDAWDMNNQIHHTDEGKMCIIQTLRYVYTLRDTMLSSGVFCILDCYSSAVISYSTCDTQLHCFTW